MKRKTMMTDNAGVVRRARRAWPLAARTAVAIVATAGLALLAAACSNSSPSSRGPGASSRSAVAYSRCVRSHGVPDFPDPDSSGGFDKSTLSQLSASNSRYQAATQACGHLLPNSSGRTAAEVQQEWSGMRNFARCMRSHGVPDWPDPTPYPQRPTDPTYILPSSIQPIPQIISKMDVCLRLVPDNAVLGHIDNDNWSSVQQQMAAQTGRS